MNSFTVFEKGCFYCKETDTESAEEEFEDSDGRYAIMARDDKIGIVTERGYHGPDIHWVDNDDDKQYRIERHNDDTQYRNVKNVAFSNVR